MSAPLGDAGRWPQREAGLPAGDSAPGGRTSGDSGSGGSALVGSSGTGRVRVAGFGPSALATPANAVTAARLLAAPVVVVMVAVAGPSWPAFAVAFMVAASDGVDGWLARRQGPTRSGAFIDPLADKIAVLGVLAVVAARGEISWVPVAVIAAREVAMSIYRSVMGRRGVSIPARRSAKAKTVVQLLAGGLCLMPPMAVHHNVLAAVVWVAVVLTVVSGGQYLVDGRRVGSPRGPVAPGNGTLAGAAEVPGVVPGSPRTGA